MYGPREIPRRADFSLEGVLSTHWHSAQWNAQNRDKDKELAIALREALLPAVCVVRLFKLLSFESLLIFKISFAAPPAQVPSRRVRDPPGGLVRPSRRGAVVRHHVRRHGAGRGRHTHAGHRGGSELGE